MQRVHAALLSAFGAALLAATYLVVLSVNEFGHLRRTIAEFDREADRAREFHNVIDEISHSISSFTAVALDLSPEERRVFLERDNRHFANFRSLSLQTMESAKAFLSEDEQEALADALISVKHSWEEISDAFSTGMEEAARAYHFLQISDEIEVARDMLSAMEEQAARGADQAMMQTFDRIEGSAGSLIKIVAAIAVTSFCALLGIGVFALATRRANTDLTSTLHELEHRDAALAVQNGRFDTALRHMSQGLCMFDGDERLIVANQRFGEVYRLPEDLVRPGIRLEEMAQGGGIMHSPIGECDGFACAIRSLLSTGKPGTATHELSDGRTVEIWCRPMENGGCVATFEDITERRRAEAQIAHMARHDALTGLGNRALFRDEMKRALVRVDRGGKIGIICIDLDRFKIVNDTLGHPIGDALLQAVSERLSHSVRDVDTVVRLGGDEFAIIVVDEAQPEVSITLAERLIEIISEPYEVDDQQLVVGASIGIAIAPHDGKDPDRLLKSADMALYRAKEDGRGTVRIFESEMDARLQSRRELELQLRQALANGEFALHYQPLVDLDGGKISGFEALLRWNSSERGIVSPAEFVPLAEEIGLIIPLSEWVLQTACREAVTWPEAVKVAVNLSPIHFYHGDLVQTVTSALSLSGLPPGRLELEITESVLLQDTHATIATLTALKRLGVRIAMDDFGTGYCSLSYLQRFPFDKIKIDQSFVRDLGNSTDALAIIRAVSSLADSLGIATTAEGVETEDQLRKVQGEGCTEAQGFLFSRPAPSSDIPKILAAQGQKATVAA